MDPSITSDHRLKHRSGSAVYFDMRLFKGIAARGMINASIALLITNPNIRILINPNNDQLIDLILRHGIDEDRLIKGRIILMSFKFYSSTIILPFQRALPDVAVMAMLNFVTLETFVHDLHFLSRRALLTPNVSGLTHGFKKAWYLATIFLARTIYVDSTLVRRQIRLLFKRETIKVPIQRVFLSSDAGSSHEVKRDLDYLIKLDGREYKGHWCLDALRFGNPTAIVGVEKGFFPEVKRILLAENPNLVLKPVDVLSDADLISAYRRSVNVLCLSRHEGFGFLPYEAAFFGSNSIVLRCSSFIEVSSVFESYRIASPIHLCGEHNVLSPEASMLASRHVFIV